MTGKSGRLTETFGNGVRRQARTITYTVTWLDIGADYLVDIRDTLQSFADQGKHAAALLSMDIVDHLRGP